MSKKKKNDPVVDIEMEIIEATAHLEELKKKQEKLKLKSLIESHFNSLPQSIENIAAHIAIRTEEPIVILFDYVEDRFHLYYKDNICCSSECAYNESGNYVSNLFEVEYICSFDQTFDESSMDYRNYFGCVITPDGDEYTIEPLKINMDGKIVFTEEN